MRGTHVALAVLFAQGCLVPVNDRLDAGAADSGSCALASTSTLPGVSIRFTSDRCVFSLAQAAAGLHIPYEVVVTNDLAAVSNEADPADASRRTEAGRSGLHVFEMLTGNSQQYCVCDSGEPSGAMLMPNPLLTGSYASTFAWDGRNWLGPSDTSNPKGAPFPPGEYRLEVRARGKWVDGSVAREFQVLSAFSITLVP